VSLASVKSRLVLPFWYRLTRVKKSKEGPLNVCVCACAQQWAEQILIDCSSGSALTLLVGRQEGHLSCKKQEWWGVGVVVSLVRGADLHMSQLMPLPLTVSCFSKIQTGFTFLVLAHLGSPGKRAVKQVCVCRSGMWWANVGNAILSSYVGS